jgi:hypothetical protein
MSKTFISEAVAQSRRGRSLTQHVAVDRVPEPQYVAVLATVRGFRDSLFSQVLRVETLRLDDLRHQPRRFEKVLGAVFIYRGSADLPGYGRA